MMVRIGLVIWSGSDDWDVMIHFVLKRLTVKVIGSGRLD